MANGLPNGMKLQSILKDPSYEKDGQVYIDPDWLKWADVSDEFVVSDPSQCEHGEQVCSECVDSWREDYMFRLVDEKGNTGEWFGSVL
jgi:hypothetical protein